MPQELTNGAINYYVTGWYKGKVDGKGRDRYQFKILNLSVIRYIITQINHHVKVLQQVRYFNTPRYIESQVFTWLFF
jgi:hypothetical protein